MKRTKPPFRADQVGSLLRTGPLKEARARRQRGEISAAELRAVEDREIEQVIREQEAVGLEAVTDGEFRRSWWHFDFLKGLDGVTSHEHREWLPIVENTQDWAAGAAEVEALLRQRPDAHGLLIRRHGLYTWGREFDEAVRHLEVLEFLPEVVGRSGEEGGRSWPR